MSDDFQYGLCRPWRATISTEFCRLYKASGRDKCQTCEGLIMDSSNSNTIEAKAADPTDQRPALKDRLKTLMDNKPATAKDVAQAAGVSIFPVRAWLKGETIPTVGQAKRLDEFFLFNFAEEYKDLLRPDKPTVKTNAAAPKSDKDSKPSNYPADVLKNAAARLDKMIGYSDSQTHQEAAGDSVIAADNTNDRQMAMVILFKVLECLSLIMGEKTGDYINND